MIELFDGHELSAEFLKQSQKRFNEKVQESIDIQKRTMQTQFDREIRLAKVDIRSEVLEQIKADDEVNSDFEKFKKKRAEKLKTGTDYKEPKKIDKEKDEENPTLTEAGIVRQKRREFAKRTKIVEKAEKQFSFRL
jgi:hypothetical protein